MYPVGLDAFLIRENQKWRVESWLLIIDLSYSEIDKFKLIADSQKLQEEQQLGREP